MGWRRPALAPVYALVTAFVVVFAIGTFTSRSATAATVLQVDAGKNVDVNELAGSVVEVRELTGAQVAVGTLSAQGTYNLPDSAGGRKVCLRLPAHWQVTAPAMAADSCTASPLANPPAANLQFAVVRDGRVQVIFQPPQAAELFNRVTVTVQDITNAAYSESGPPDASGYYQQRGSLAGHTVCVEPPSEWTVSTPSAVRTGRAWCQTAKDPHEDVKFNLVKVKGSN